MNDPADPAYLPPGYMAAPVPITPPPVNPPILVPVVDTNNEKRRNSASMASLPFGLIGFLVGYSLLLN